MFDIGWSEMAVIAVIALIVIGPRDLPKVLRTAGQWAGKARKMAREFRSSVDEMVRESEIDEVRKTVQTATHYDVGKEIENTIDPGGEITRDLDPTAPTAAPPEAGNDAATEAATGAGAAPDPGASPATPAEPTAEIGDTAPAEATDDHREVAG